MWGRWCKLWSYSCLPESSLAKLWHSAALNSSTSMTVCHVWHQYASWTDCVDCPRAHTHTLCAFLCTNWDFWALNSRSLEAPSGGGQARSKSCMCLAQNRLEVYTRLDKLRLTLCCWLDPAPNASLMSSHASACVSGKPSKSAIHFRPKDFQKVLWNHVAPTGEIIRTY